MLTSEYKMYSDKTKTTMALTMLQRVDISKDDPNIVCFVIECLQP